MKILVISPAYPPMHAGESANAYHLCRRLAEHNLDVHVLTSVGNAETLDAGVTVHPIMRSWSWLEGLKFARFVKQCAPDAVLLMYLDGMYKYHPMITFAPTIVKHQLPRTTFVTRFESPFGGADPRSTLTARVGRKLAEMISGRYDVLYDWGTLLRDSDYVIALCKGHQSALMEKWPKEKKRERIVLIPPPPNVLVCPDEHNTARRRGRVKLGIGAADFVIAFFGYVYPKKGIETLLEAFEMVQREQSRARLVIIGGTIDLDAEVSGRYWNDVQRLCGDLGVAEKTTWTGAFKSDGEEASLYLRAADVCVLPLLGGVQLNNSSFSAMAAHGMPIVTTRGSTMDPAFVDGENVLLCEPRDAGSLAKGIRVLMDSEELREHLRVGVTNLAREWLSWDEAIKRTLAVMENGA